MAHFAGELSARARPGPVVRMRLRLTFFPIGPPQHRPTNIIPLTSQSEYIWLGNPLAWYDCSGCGCGTISCGMKAERRLSTTRSKIFWVCFMTAGTAFAQGSTESSAPPLDILKIKWQKEVRLPRNFDPSVIPTGGTFSDPASRTSTAGASSATAGVSDATRAATSAGSAAASSSSVFPESPGRLPIFYVYSMKIRNVTATRIEGIAWDYLFLDPNNNRELDSHQFLSYDKVAPDKVITLRGQLRSPPTRIILASSSRANQRPGFIERAVIECVLFADDTTWRNSNAREGVCELLKNSRNMLKRRGGPNQSQ